MEAEFDFQLNEEFEYSKKGDFTKSATISFSKPGMIVYAEVTALSQSVMAAMIDAKSLADGSSEGSDSEDAELDASTMKIMLLNSTRVKMSTVADQFKAIAKATATFDGETKLREEHIEKFDIDEFTRMLCEYIANFIAPSLFSGMDE